MKKSRVTSPRPSPEKSKSYWAVFREAAGVVFRNPFLWVLGLLTGLGGASTQVKSQDFVGVWAFSVLMVAFAVLFLVIFILSILAEAGIILSFDGVVKGEKWTLDKALRYARRYFFRILGQMVVALIFVMLVVLVFVGPAALVVDGFGVTSVTGWLGIIIASLLTFFLVLVLLFAQRFLVLKNQRIFESFRSSIRLLFSRFWQVVGAGLSGLVFAFLSVVLFVGVGILLAFLGMLIMAPLSALGLSSLVSGVFAFGPLFLGTLVFIGWLSASLSGYWTILFRRFTS